MTSTSHSKSTSAHSSNAADEKSKATKAVEATKSTAKSVAAKVADTTHASAEAAKHSVADEVTGVASALRSAAQDMRNGSPQERTIGQIAESLADAGDAIRGKDMGDVMRDVSNIARRNPALFLGGAALLGFAATRFAKASQPTDRTSAPQGAAVSDYEWPEGPRSHSAPRQTAARSGNFNAGGAS